MTPDRYRIDAERTMSDLPTGTITFLFTDIEGSTSLWQQHRDAMPAALARHHAILRNAIESHNGYVFQIIGDAFCAAFFTPSDALAATIEAQRALRAETWGVTGALRVRMGLHTGVTEVHLNDVKAGQYASGLTLSRAQRIMSAGHGGQILVSSTTYELLRGQFPDGVTLRDLSEHRLKGLLDPEHLWQVVAPDLPYEFPPLQSLNVIPNNLPAQLSTFIGREKEIAQIERLLGKYRLVTLTGAGGIGKTRLTIQVGREVLPLYPHGVWLVQLAPLADPALVPQAVMTTFDLQQDARRSPLAALTDYLREKTTLLVLDNCEHVIDACAQLAGHLLGHCPEVRILASSREALGIEGETAMRVPSLSLPTGERATRETLEQSEAVRLFVERAAAALPAFELTDANAPAVVQVCRRLDGVALAIELAAARVKLLTVEQIAARLDDAFRLLTGGSRTALPRQQTLRATIDWSYNLLAEDERTLLRRLSVFVGGWTLEAAEAVCAGEQIDAPDVLELLTQLVNKSLVLVECEQGEAARYGVLETTRQYGAEKLAEVLEEERAAHDRHCAYYAEFLQQREAELVGRKQRAALAEIGADIENVRAAWDWALARDRMEDLERILEPLADVCRLHGWYREGETLFSRAVQELAGVSESGPRLLLGKALLQQGRFTELLGNGPEANRLLQASLVLFRDLGAMRQVASATCLLGGTERLYGAPGRELCQDGLALFQQLGDTRGVAGALQGLAWCAWHNGEYVDAKQRFEDSLALFRQIGDPEGMTRCLHGLGHTCWILGKYEQAEQTHTEMLHMCQDTRNRGGIARALGDLGIDACGLRQYDRARALVEQSLALYRDMGNVLGVKDALADLGEVANGLWDYAAAIGYAREAVSFVELGCLDYDLGAFEYRVLGNAACGLGNLAEARAYLYHSLQAVSTVQTPHRYLWPLLGVARLLVRQGEKERALELLALVMSHRYSWQIAKDQAALLAAELEAELPPDVAAAALERGRARDLDATVVELLVELGE